MYISIVQGKYDLVCPMDTAWELLKVCKCIYLPLCTREIGYGFERLSCTVEIDYGFEHLSYTVEPPLTVTSDERSPPIYCHFYSPLLQSAAIVIYDFMAKLPSLNGQTDRGSEIPAT